MPAIYQYGKNYSGGGGTGNAKEKVLSYEEYTALTEEERNNGMTYYVPDYPLGDGVVTEDGDEVVFVTTSEDEQIVTTKEFKNVVSLIGEEPIAVGNGTITGAINELSKTGGTGAVATVTVTTESEDLFNTIVLFVIKGGEVVSGTFDSTGKCTVALKYEGTYTITASDGGITALEITTAGTYETTVTALPKTVITITTNKYAEKAIIVAGPESSVGAFGSDGTFILTVRTIGDYIVTCEGQTKKIVIDTLDTTVEVDFDEGSPETDKPIIYAFHIDDSESDPASAVTYLGDAEGLTPAHMDYETDTFIYGSWENAFFMPRPCMLKYDGTVDYYLDDNYYGKKEDGTASDITNVSYEGNAMMEWGRDGKQIWVKVDTASEGCSGTSPTIYISDTQVDDSYKAYSFINNQGNLVDHFYTPIYNGSNISSKLRSISGQKCSVSTTADTEISLATANNTTSDVLWYTETFSDRCLINYLLILIGRSLDTQTVFGYGYAASSNSAAISTGTMNNKGLFWGENTGKYGVKVFGMENWWGNVFRRISGLINIENGTTGAVKSKMTYGTQDGSTAEGYNLTGDGYNDAGVVATGNKTGYYTKATFSDNGMVPSEWNSGSTSTNYCDNGSVYATRTQTDVAFVGGYWGSALAAGAFYVNLIYTASYSTGDRGASISCKPLS